MSTAHDFGFGKFVPGFDFLQNLPKTAGAQIPGMPSWVAPTMDPKEIDKRIEELGAVLFWLEQNGTALKATIQALEVQKMTLATLKDMNLDMASMAKAFTTPSSPSAKAEKTAGAAKPDAAVDPMQLWSALTQQFQTIAANAMKEVAKHAHAAPVAAKKAEPAPAKTPRKTAARK